MGTRKTKNIYIFSRGRKVRPIFIQTLKGAPIPTKSQKKDCVETRIRIYELRNPIDSTIIISIENDLDGVKKKLNKLATKRNRITKGKTKKRGGKETKRLHSEEE
jgi:hypothetical protein